MIRFVAAVLVSVLTVTSASGQEQIFIPPFDSNTSGEIKGPVTLVGLEESIEVLAFQHEVSRDFGDGTGLPRGAVQHTPVIITKDLDLATPLLADTLARNGTIPELTLHFFRTDTNGARAPYHVITLNDARIVSVRHARPKGPEGVTREEVAFIYNRITWEDVQSGNMAFDNWRETRRDQ